MSKDNGLYTMARPVKDYRQPTVRPIRRSSLIFGSAWTEKDKTTQSPRLVIMNDGTVLYQNNQVLVSSCKMHIYNFPFDIQSCNLTFKSLLYPDSELQLRPQTTSEAATNYTREMMRTQFEWLFININITKTTSNRFAFEQDEIIFTINMKRRSVLYIINFILPVLFFLCLDLASFLISDSSGEKLSFKVTVLLAVTVMQLILNEILPSSSNRIPLIALYCIGIFAMMLLSLLESILVMYLLEKDKEPSGDQSVSEQRGDKQDEGEEEEEEKKKKKWRKWNPCVRLCDVSTDEQPTELLKVSGSRLMDGSQDSEKLVEDLNEAMKTLNELLTKREGGKSDYWARKTKQINKVFFIFYVIAALLFLVFMFFNWRNAP
ncbi:hypothetical protein INR49_027287 [Caranx melampygus]|nr:hypothetical protein INR49_027287 [Caranx melampygus]